MTKFEKLMPMYLEVMDYQLFAVNTVEKVDWVLFVSLRKVKI